jgi:hypothetical protein
VREGVVSVDGTLLFSLLNGVKTNDKCKCLVIGKAD